MSDSHVDKDKTARVNFDEALKAITVGSVASLVSPLGVFGASGWFLSEIYKVLKSKKEIAPAPDNMEVLREIIETRTEQGLSELVNADYLPPGGFVAPAQVSANSVYLSAISLAGVAPTAEGTLATFTFEVVSAKASTLMLNPVVLSDVNAQQLPLTAVD